MNINKISPVLIMGLFLSAIAATPAVAKRLEQEYGVEYVGHEIVLKQGYLIADYKKLMVQALNARAAGRSEELKELFKTGRVAFTKEGDSVHVVSVDPSSGIARVTRKVGTPVLWTEIDALGYVAPAVDEWSRERKDHGKQRDR